MKALVLEVRDPDNSFQTEALNSLTASMSSMKWEAEIVSAAAMHIEYCAGCGNCTYKTPGICSLKDDMPSLFPKIIQADLLLTFSPVLFGCVHWQIKKVLDRMLPIIAPRYVIRSGELHHQRRYPHRQMYAAIGVLPKENKEQASLFSDLIRRNTINMDAQAGGSIVLREDEGLDAARRRILEFVDTTGELYD
ncbi:MAG: flavodoxin family protein [Sediminispirochaetaceae bacterium]